MNKTRRDYEGRRGNVAVIEEQWPFSSPGAVRSDRLKQILKRPGKEGARYGGAYLLHYWHCIKPASLYCLRRSYWRNC